MLRLDNHLTIDEATLKAPNLCDRFTDADLRAIGAWCFDGYKRDVASRERWSRRTEAAMDLALQIQKGKSFPWPGCANVAFPLVTIASLQFHARAYPSIISGSEVVRCRLTGPDPTGRHRLRADRISKHMSWQLLEQDEDWEEQQDRALINVPVVGTAFKKSYYNASEGHNESDLVLAKDLVLDYWAKSVETCPRKTHIIPLFRNDIYERIKRGTFRDILEDAWYKQNAQPRITNARHEQNNRAGQTVPQTDETTPFIGLEQHCSLDLDGDGYAEPYIITLEETSQTALRIVTRFDRIEDVEYTPSGEILRISAMEYFTKIPFIPNPDGGIMDIGFGVLLGPLNESVNSLVNILIDSGVMGATAGGFLGRGAKLRGGVYTFTPFGWNRIDSSGEDISKSVFPLPVREPSQVLFTLLSFLVEYVNRISGSTDTLAGENPGQNTPAETTRTMVEQGQKIYSSIYKRIWRSMKQEFKKLYILNSIHMPARQIFGAEGAFAQREDYLEDPSTVVPVADPNITSEAARFMQARMIREAAMQVAGYDPAVVERHFLKSMQVDGIDAFYPGVEKTGQPKDVKLQIAEMEAQLEQAKLAAKTAELDFEKARFAAELQEEAKMNDAKIIELMAKAAKEVEEAGGVKDDNRTNMLNALIGVMKQRNELITRRVELMLKELEIGTKTNGAGKSGGGAISRMATAPDDTVAASMGEETQTELAGSMGAGALQ